jgi:proteasome lid subunit RPN8/RPN11
MDYVIIDPECFFAMVFSSIEVHNRETTGFLMGNKRRRMIHGKMETALACEIAYPIQTARRKPTSVTTGNVKAFERIRSLFPSLGLYLVGEYHSHPKIGAELTESDLEYIKEQIEQLNGSSDNLNVNCWLELVIAIRKKRYRSKQKIGWSWSDYNKKVRCIIKTNPYLGYDLTIGGFWVQLKGDRIRTNETIVFVPWVKGYWS